MSRVRVEERIGKDSGTLLNAQWRKRRREGEDGSRGRREGQRDDARRGIMDAALS
jgi:hypothetical protein